MAQCLEYVLSVHKAPEFYTQPAQQQASRRANKSCEARELRGQSLAGAVEADKIFV